MLYLFAGIARDGDIRSHLQKICASQQLVLTMHEFDLVRGPDQDLSSTVLWDNLFKMIQTGVLMFLFSARLALPFRGLGIVTRGRLVLGHFVHMHTCLAFLGCVMLTIGELSKQIS